MTPQLIEEIERIPCRVFRQASDASRSVAEQIAAMIRGRAAEGRTCVLGLATGSTPTGVYDELIRLHREDGLSFQNVITFNLDEYYPMQPEELQSYVRFMKEHLFDHVDIKPENAHVPDGTLSEEEVADYCRRYEGKIAEAGGIDLQLLGIGRTGHIGFNEPGSGKNSRTRMITLDRVTRRDAASDFFGEDNVPRRAITMGVGTILDARQVVLMAWGEGKAPIVAEAVEGDISTIVAASFLQEHPNAQVVLDQAAAEQLTRCLEPWSVGPVNWDDAMVRKAIIWLARKLEKPLLKLTAEDYNEEGLQDLLATCGSAYDLNLRVFRSLQATITGWPGGKPERRKQPGDRTRPGDHLFPKRVLIFSPHPDDDVISMGGTLIRLVDQGHDVHVAYQTSGNIAVFDDDAQRFADFVSEFNRHFNIDVDRTAELESQIDGFLKHKQPGQVDAEAVQFIKGVIRRTEARAATRCCGVSDENLHFMDMPFYETGRVRKKPLGEEDVRITVELLRSVQPHQVYVAGDLSDPHGTHRVCLSAVLQACGEVSQDDWYADMQVWLYRGAWQEWGPEQIEMAVPISPEELLRKRVAIFKHESQKDKALFPGADPREFWQRAEDRNRATARLYDQLGLAEYEAIEGFVEWKGDTSLV
ncbi:Glucosamine-6-phosphate deaminase 1 [Posidoniimonas corsicana]|uniref:Glucosamine-6-phosphate deaminase n=1 Tax=Posidoniimonas corsicana TaxID=1938618 RepID=A0A5C5VF73_9BACT|nr:glucosamine-6-phosphate deaminase [Posidoniimonas corsicana]TWT36519.1 Glucosamine-6-phosphate deaminase 1 [Posidoniimonas corsicana]